MTEKRVLAKVPGSKSMTQRGLIISALATQPTRLLNALRCDDSERLTELLCTLGTTVNWRENEVQIIPSTELRPSGKTQYCGNAGTTMRFGICLSLLCNSELLLDGDARMRERPIAPLGEALQQMGCRVRYLEHDGFPPLGVLRGKQIKDAVHIDATLSSQFASGLALVAPRLPQGLSLTLSDDAVSLSYLHMTTKMMERGGIRLAWQNPHSLRIEPGEYFAKPTSSAVEISIEPDWSSAAFLLAAGRILDVDVEISGLPNPEASLQGDAVFSYFLDELSLSKEHEFNISDCPDLIAPLVMSALFAPQPTKIRGAAHARLKESDRIAVLCHELRKAGVRLDEHPDGLDLFPYQGHCENELVLNPAGDHRMAMAFGLLSLRVPQIRILDKGCVSKSFPEFWNELRRISS